MSNKRPVQASLLVLYLAALYLPIYVFFHDRGGTAFLHSLSYKVSLQLLFPLLGLYAFTFVAWQILIATNLRWLRKLWPRILQFHRFEGSFALLFAIMHPSFIAVGYGLASYLHYNFVAPPLRWWLVPAYAGLTIMIATVLTALLAWKGRNIPWWRKLHRLNYLVFALVWTHSWFIGSDLRTPLLRRVWLAYLLAVIISAALKYYPKFVKQEAVHV
jgi:predicted ferric reductase